MYPILRLQLRAGLVDFQAQLNKFAVEQKGAIGK
jgi:hypothetical protein